MKRKRSFKFKIEESILRQLYEKEQLTYQQIAFKLGCKSLTPIFRAMKLYNIKSRSKFIDLTNKIYGSISVINKYGKIKDETTWWCRCDCGKELEIPGVSLRSGNTKTCGCSLWFTGNKSRHWKGYGEIPHSFWTDIINSAIKRDIYFDIDIKYGWDIFVKQNKKCALTGDDLFFHKSCSSKDRGNSSLDRINNNLGYIQDNVQWVHKDVNRMKWILSNDRFIDFCRKVVDFHDP
jgi:hypothetical protein